MDDELCPYCQRQIEDMGERFVSAGRGEPFDFFKPEVIQFTCPHCEEQLTASVQITYRIRPYRDATRETE